MAARPPLPRSRAQRRDQRAQGQPQRPLRARAIARLAGLRRRPQAPAAARDAGPVGLRIARQHVRAARRRRTRRAARDDDAHPAGMGRQVPHGPRRPRLLRVPLRAHGAVGRPCRRRVHRRHRRRRDARPQRSPPSPLDAHQGRPVRPRLRGRRARPPSRGHRPPRTPPPRSDRLARPREAPPPRRHRAQDLLRAPPPVPPLGGAEPHLDPGPLHRDRPLEASRRPGRQGRAPARPGTLRLHARGPEPHPQAHGRDWPRAPRSDGQRRRARRTLQEAPPPLRLLQAALRAGHEPADRPDPRGTRHVPHDVHRQRRQHPLRDARARTPRQASPPRAYGRRLAAHQESARFPREDIPHLLLGQPQVRARETRRRRHAGGQERHQDHRAF